MFVFRIRRIRKSSKQTFAYHIFLWTVLTITGSNISLQVHILNLCTTATVFSTGKFMYISNFPFATSQKQSGFVNNYPLSLDSNIRGKYIYLKLYCMFSESLISPLFMQVWHTELLSHVMFTTINLYNPLNKFFF